ncbi:MAG: DUF4249 domain-containing protein [Bacteroidales bacterium]|jgi:hypothetical protein|nr:DUF4249 domain-containing protein [Bacteroidales bacterium]MCI2146009.1 DUF4249 domain-containing protein [Bacteroidales bacterium]
MKHNIKYLICLLSLAAVVVSCEKTIKFSGEEQKSMLVLNSIATPGDTLGVNVSYSIFFLDNLSEYAHDGISLPDGECDIKAVINGSSTYKFTRSDLTGDYVCSYVPAEGDRVQISADVPGFDSVKAETTVPEKASFDFTSHSISKVDSTEDLLKISFSIHDRENEDDFYMLRVFLITDYSYMNPETGKPDSTAFVTRCDFASSSPVFRKLDVSSLLEEIFGDEFQESTLSPLFSDHMFDGEDYEIEVLLNANHFSGPVSFSYGGTESISDYTYSYKVRMDLTAVSDDYYYYYMSLENKDNGYDLGELFGESSQVYSNVDGGIGFLGALTGNVKEFDF